MIDIGLSLFGIMRKRQASTAIERADILKKAREDAKAEQDRRAADRSAALLGTTRLSPPVSTDFLQSVAPPQVTSTFQWSSPQIVSPRKSSFKSETEDDKAVEMAKKLSIASFAEEERMKQKQPDDVTKVPFFKISPHYLLIVLLVSVVLLVLINLGPVPGLDQINGAVSTGVANIVHILCGLFLLTLVTMAVVLYLRWRRRRCAETTERAKELIDTAFALLAASSDPMPLDVLQVNVLGHFASRADSKIWASVVRPKLEVDPRLRIAPTMVLGESRCCVRLVSPLPRGGASRSPTSPLRPAGYSQPVRHPVPTKAQQQGSATGLWSFIFGTA